MEGIDPVGTRERHPLDARAYRIGLFCGALVFIALLGVVKDIYAVLDTEGRGQMAWGFLMLRYSSLQRVWLGYKLTGGAAWLAAFPHILVYAAVAYGLIGMRRWVRGLLAGYLVYVVASQILYMLFYPLGFLTGTPLPESFVRGEWLFLALSVPAELACAWLVWRARDLFTR